MITGKNTGIPGRKTLQCMVLHVSSARKSRNSSPQAVTIIFSTFQVPVHCLRIKLSLLSQTKVPVRVPSLHAIKSLQVQESYWWLLSSIQIANLLINVSS